MTNYGPRWLLQLARSYGHWFFLHFGIHCATHQIRIILVSCVVITSLFYPALALYSSYLSYPGSHRDLHNVWQNHPALRLREDAASRARCGVGRTLRIERILIQSSLSDDEDEGALNNQILTSTLALERALQSTHSVSSRCLKCTDSRTSCFMLSPLAFWNHDPAMLLSDPNILDTLSLTRNVSIGGISVTPDMVLAGKGPNEPHVTTTNHFDYAKFLALTYFFPNSDCSGSTEHREWLGALKKAAFGVNADVMVQMRAPELIALEFDRTLSKNKGWTAISALLYLAYTGFFAYVSWSMRRMDAVHSRIGVTFTALVEIAVSTITSLSVCALVGFKVTMVPWELLPIVIVFVGAENMFNLVDAVGKTPVTLSVKQRIAQGLSRAGTSNTLKVVSYNAILGVLAVFAGRGAIRQFCVFAIVVLVAHWFLAHTFFLAVLSIDMQRLELDDLLRKDPSFELAVPVVRKENSNSKQPKSAWNKLAFVVQSVLKGRATKNISLLMLLAITATLYYTAQPTHTPHDIPTPHGALSRGKPKFRSPHTHNSNSTNPTGLELDADFDAAWQIWKTLNPTDSTLHLRVEVPAIVTFQPPKNEFTEAQTQGHRSRFSMRALKELLALLKVLVLPIALTTAALWGLLLYLLKDAELLEAQRHRSSSSPSRSSSSSPDGDKEEGWGAARLDGRAEFSTLPRAFRSDVELIATSLKGGVVASVGMGNEIAVWWLDNASTSSLGSSRGQSMVDIDASDVLLGVVITSLAVMERREDCLCAVGTGSGSGDIVVWAVSPAGSVRKIAVLAMEGARGKEGGVVDLQFVVPHADAATLALKPLPRSRTASFSQPASPTDEKDECKFSLVATYESGLAAKWTVSPVRLDVTCYTPSPGPSKLSLIKSVLLRVSLEEDNERVLIAFCMDDGSVELSDPESELPLLPPDLRIQAGSPTDVVSRVHVCRVEMAGTSRLVIGVATESGAISLWDAWSRELIHLVEEPHGRVTHLRVSPIPCETCHYCGQLPQESFALTVSVDSIVLFYRTYLPDRTTRRCSCTSTQPRGGGSLTGRHTRSNSIASSIGTSSPSIPRARLSTAFETSPFPVSGHGVHSRRASEKESVGRRSSETLAVPMPGGSEEYEPLDGARTPASSFSPPLWNNAFTVLVADTACERGCWDGVGERIHGVRRMPRTPAKPNQGGKPALLNLSQQGLTTATLERWELWIFDLSTARLRSSPLAGLVLKEGRVESESDGLSSSRSSTSSLNESIPRLPFTRVSPFLISCSRSFAGFGNTVGVFNLSSP